MEKIGLLIKQISEKQIRNNIKDSNAVFIISYSGLNGPSLSRLRKDLKSSYATVIVVKNNVAQRALRDLGWEGLIKAVQGPCGLVFVKDDPVGASRLLYNFSKEFEKLKLEGGFLKDKILETKDIQTMARLPPREALRAQVVMTLNSPIFGLAIALNQISAKFVYCIDQIKTAKAQNKK